MTESLTDGTSPKVWFRTGFGRWPVRVDGGLILNILPGFYLVRKACSCKDVKCEKLDVQYTMLL